MNAQTQIHNTNPNLTPENQAQTCQADYLEASNFQDEQSLTKENRKQLHKMMKYVRTFPLQDHEIETIRRDLLGMALEAQTRGSSLQSSLGKKPRDFCDDIIFSIGGIKSPGGRKLLRIAGGYYQIVGAMGLISSLLVLTLSLIDGAVHLFSTGTAGILTSEFIASIINTFIAVLYLMAGTRAYKYANNVTKSYLAMRWGIGMLVLDILFYIKRLIENLTTASGETFLLHLTLFVSGVALLFLIFPVLYIIGAHRNRPHSAEYDM